MLIGIDDTDSLKGGCTTYLAAILCRKLGTLTRILSGQNPGREKSGTTQDRHHMGLGTTLLLEELGTTQNRNHAKLGTTQNRNHAKLGTTQNRHHEMLDTTTPPKSTTNYPKLIRLNPNIPYKTRGNGAVALEINTKNPEEIKGITLNLVKEHAHIRDKRTNPGVVFIENLNLKNRRTLNKFYQRAVSELVTIEEAEKIAGKTNAETHKFNNGRGIIGALAAIGAELDDRTYELLAYRKRENYGKPKKIDKNTVFLMNEKLYPTVFNSVDPETNQILITPHGYDPVFCGIRGESPEAVMDAWNTIKPLEGIELIQIFETNQGTDAHLRKKKIPDLKPYDCAILDGEVSSQPRTTEGSHVFFSLSNDTGGLDCAAYEPTGGFRDVIRKLLIGDKIRAYGGIGKYSNTLNLEKVEILKLKKKHREEPPLCCGRRMTSAGRGKGFKCKKCSKRLSETSAVVSEVPRDLKPGFYEVPPRAMRHLSKPLVRM